jgi:purine-nucleoside phosphorylase
VISTAQIEEATAAIRRQAPAAPRIAVILGSGLGALADNVAQDAAVPYAQIPHFPVSTASGHRGRLVIGRLEGTLVALMQGRVHLYEGYSAAEVSFPVRVLAGLGVRTLLVTNAAGGINRAFRRGDLMVITDHINFSGTNPLAGPNEEVLGPRFADMWRAYDPALIALAGKAARREKIAIRRGVYLAVAGPSYETPAELEMMRRWGADAVGMSTVPEVIVARHAGVRVLGIAAIANVAGKEPTSHAAVLEAVEALGPRFQRLIRRIIRMHRE